MMRCFASISAIVLLYLSSTLAARESLYNVLLGSAGRQSAIKARVQLPATNAPYKCSADADCLKYLGRGKCDNSTGNCYLGLFGESCSTAANCRSKVCSEWLRVCVQQVCDNTCTADFKKFCRDNFCYPQQPEKGVCHNDSDCLTNHCLNGKCKSVAVNTTQSCGCKDCPACPDHAYCSGSGLCASKAEEGQPCSINYMCKSNTCSQGFCSPPRQLCGCSSCPACPAGTRCSAIAGGVGMCVKSSLGSPCSSNADCASNTCRNGICSYPKIKCGCWSCAPCPAGTFCTAQKLGNPDGAGVCAPQQPNGFPCSADSMCASHTCRDGSCANSASACGCPGCPSCPAGYYCSGSKNGQCLKQVKDLSPCSSSNQCLSGFCNPPTYTCGLDTGRKCPGSDAPCPVGEYCQYSPVFGYTCVVQKPSGVGCAYNWECSSQVCDTELCL